MRNRISILLPGAVALFAWAACSDEDSASVPTGDAGADASMGGTPSAGASGDGGAGDGGTTPITGGTGGDTGGAGMGGGGTANAPDAAPPEAGSADAGDTQAPVITTAATWVRSPRISLAGTLELATDEPTTVDVTLTGAGGEEIVVPTSPEGTTHSIVVLGLLPDSTYLAAITVRDAAGNETTTTVDVTSGSLPDGFPQLSLVTSDATKMEPGVTLFNGFRWTPNIDNDWGAIIAVDGSGRPIWYFIAPERTGDVRRLGNGNLVYEVPNLAAVELDMLGNEIQRWTASGLGVDTIHHEVFEIDDTRFVTLGSALAQIDGYPAGDGGTLSYNVVEDTVVEFSRSGSVERTIHLLDLLDPLRTRPGFDGPFWNTVYPDAVGGTKDWTHANAVIHDPSDDTFIVSARHQDWILKVDRQTGGLVWRFGEDGDFTLSGGGDFPYHAHAPELGPGGNLIVYDNGNGRTNLGSEPPYTRAVEYSLNFTGDAGGSTAQQVWEFRNEGYFCQFLGDTDRQPGGTTLITDGGCTADPTGAIFDPTNEKFARIVEVTGDASPEIVFHLDVSAPATAPDGGVDAGVDAGADGGTAVPTDGVSVYRSERLPSLYP